ncbi:MAG: hypothetical protein Q7T78_09160 [Rhodoferax sp.]|nr:hypothetical protein [Rhodoferax sp.]
MAKKMVVAPVQVETFEAYRDDEKLSTTLRVFHPQAEVYALKRHL